MTEQNEDLVEETTEEQVDQQVEDVTEEVAEEVAEEVVEQKIDESKFESAGDDSVVKVDLSKPIAETEVAIEETKEQESEVEETPVIEEIIESEEVEKVEEEIEEAIAEAEVTGKPLPENIQKLVDFIDETGGDINDYVKLNRDVDKLDNSEILDEYYAATKPHLDAEERSFVLEETFGFDEDVDEPRDIKRKKIALKEQVAEAKAYLDGQKSKYYEDIKAGSKLTEDQQKAIDFFNRHNKSSENQKKLSEATKLAFQKRTDKVFNDKFKGFDYNVGDKKFRFNVKDVDKVKTTQSDINNFVNKFVDKDSTISDAAGYHKSLFTAMNPDAIANHFYEQGKADAIKGQVAKDKNINIDPRKSFGETNAGGMKVRVLGDSSSDFKFKIKNKNK